MGGPAPTYVGTGVAIQLAPPGIYATLETITGGWRLTYKDQTYREYDSASRAVDAGTAMEKRFCPGLSS